MSIRLSPRLFFGKKNGLRFFSREVARIGSPATFAGAFGVRLAFGFG